MSEEKPKYQCLCLRFSHSALVPHHPTDLSNIRKDDTPKTACFPHNRKTPAKKPPASGQPREHPVSGRTFRPAGIHLAILEMKINKAGKTPLGLPPIPGGFPFTPPSLIRGYQTHLMYPFLQTNKPGPEKRTSGEIPHRHFSLCCSTN